MHSFQFDIIKSMQNVFEYLGGFNRIAKRAKWPNERIKAVLDDAMSGDYEHTLEVLLLAMDEINGSNDHISSDEQKE